MKKTLFLIIVLAVLVSVSGCFGSLSGSKGGKEVSKYENKAEKIINALNKNYEIKEKGAGKKEKQVNPRDGYSLFSSFLSHDKEKIVYTEVKGELKDLYKGWEYHVVYKNLKTGDERVIYSFPEELSWKTSLRNIFVRDVLAQGCKALPFPIGWTKNDKKIIFQGIVPVACNTGGISGKGYFVADPKVGPLKPLRYIAFFNDHSKAVVLESGDKVICNSMNVPVNEKVIAHDIEFGTDEIMAAEEGYHYRFLNIDKKTNILKLEKVKMYDNKDKDCYEFVSKGEGVEVMLNDFK